jgi:DNA-binding transcriptional regulator GbsR (MarR family)
MNRKSLILGLSAILGVSLVGALLTRSISVQKSMINELLLEIQEVRAINDTLEQEVENLSDQLQDCTEDYQHCVAGRTWNQEELTSTEKTCPKDQK